MSEEDFREGLPSREQIEAHYEPGKQYGHWRRKGDPRAFRLGWHNDGCWHEAVAWPPWCAVIDDFESLCSSAWQPADSSNSLLPWSVVEAGCEYRSPTDDEIRAHEANGGAWAARDTSYRLLGFRDGELYRGHALRPVDLKGKPIPWSSLHTTAVTADQHDQFFAGIASRLQEIHTQKSQPKEEKTMQIDISKLSTEDRAQLRRQLDAAEPPTFNSALRSGLEHAPIELALDRAHALLDRAVDTLWAAGSEDDKATVRRFFRDALKSEYGKAGMAFGAGALLPHAADAAGALLPSESNAPRYLNRAAWLFTERGATIVAREIGSTAIDSIGPLVGTLRMLLADLVNGMRTAEAGIAGLLPAASRPLNFDAVPKPDTVEK